LSFEAEKPMNVFGEHWDNYENQILKNWNAAVGENDIGIIAGDISWAMKMSETQKDFEFISRLNGKKIIIRGNHDYWWKSISQIREYLPENIFALQNDSLEFDDCVICGTRGWRVPERGQTQTSEDKKIYDREVLRFELCLKDAEKKAKQHTPNNSSEAREDFKEKKLIAILHYPPFNCMRDDSEFTKLCEKYGVSACVYGHLHGKGGRQESVYTKGGVMYYLTSCDKLNFVPTEIKF
jgi:predicted phosphohydrolase